MKKAAGIAVDLCCFAIGFFLGGKALVGLTNSYKRRSDVEHAHSVTYEQWIDYVNSGRSIREFFEIKGYHKILIYGKCKAGEQLYHALKNTDIQVAAFMDRNAPAEGLDGIISPAAPVPDVDCVVIAPMYYYDEIYALLKEKTDKPILAIDEIWKS